MPASRPSRTTNARRVRSCSQFISAMPVFVIDCLLGKPVSHAFAKELLAGFAAAEVDKLAETKGEDWFDREKTKHQAKRNAERMYDEHYIDGQNADRYNPNEYDRPDRFDRRGW